MRLPNRKPGKYTFPQFDHVMTAKKLQAMKDKLTQLKSTTLPQAMRDTQRYGENGDFSENAEYQIAKGRLRGLNKLADELQYQINHATIIAPVTDSATVQIGHTVTITTGATQSNFTILGSTESNPSAGVISYSSPLGVALLGHAVGETVTMQAGDRKIDYTIVAIVNSAA